MWGGGGFEPPLRHTGGRGAAHVVLPAIVVDRAARLLGGAQSAPHTTAPLVAVLDGGGVAAGQRGLAVLARRGGGGRALVPRLGGVDRVVLDRLGHVAHLGVLGVRQRPKVATKGLLPLALAQAGNAGAARRLALLVLLLARGVALLARLAHRELGRALQVSRVHRRRGRRRLGGLARGERRLAVGDRRRRELRTWRMWGRGRRV